MIRNRSAPPFSVTPVLSYPDVLAAAAWLELAFGFVEHVRIGDHRVQMGVGDGAIVLTDATNGRTAPEAESSHSVMVRVSDIDAHHRRTMAAGARVLSNPADHPYGERQYSAMDLAGHHWTFTESIADVAPEEWGGTTVTPW
ncbi:MAG TPA: VOC family protein [Amnibacterium sp.]|jgi:uncharacterized glyoxalase superfamily protein PhnB|uniref:VOC family protein n=1 Tax=Amnibacterium sp. TaxID=1872496 RepID=UPI002F94F5DC